MNASNKGVKIKSAIRAGKLATNHNATKKGVKIKSAIRAGKLATNHNATRMTA